MRPLRQFPSGHFLASWKQTNDGLSWNIERPLSGQEAAELESDFSDLTTVQPGVAFNAMIENFQQWHALTWLLDGRRHRTYAERVGSDTQQLTQRFLVALTTVLTSASAYLEMREASFKQRFGKFSEQVNKFVQITNHEFDNDFSYRISAKLRNCFAHVPPMNAFSLSSIDNSVGGTSWRLKADPHLLAATGRFNPMREELEDYEGLLDIHQVVNDYERALIRVEEKALELQLAALREPLERVERVLKALDRSDSDVPYAVLHVTSAGEANPDFKWSSSISQNLLDNMKGQLGVAFRLRPSGGRELFELGGLLSEEALNVVESRLLDDNPALLAAIAECTTSPRDSVEAVSTLSVIAAVSLIQLQAFTGASVHEQLGYYREQLVDSADEPPTGPDKTSTDTA